MSPGIAMGPAITFHFETIDVPRYAISDPAKEMARYDAAVALVRESLVRLRDQTAEELGPTHAAIFGSHLEILSDVTLRPEIEKRVVAEKVNVEYIVEEQIGAYTRMLSQLDDPVFRDRSTDFVDIGKRILGHLLEHEFDTLEDLDHPCIVVTHDLSPSDTVNMDMPNTLALVTDAGGSTSHMAILAKAFEIPAVVGLRFAGARVAPGDTVIVDGSQGMVIIRPSEITLVHYEAEKQREEEERKAYLTDATEGPCATVDGLEIATLVNIELPIETDASLKKKCEGIGLFRTEYLFMNRPSFPTEEEQYRAYRHVVEVMHPAPVTIRTLDTGGDKVVPYVNQEEEANPQLGWRSIRFCLDRPDIFKAQLRALYRASVHGNMKIMFPLISGVDELRESLKILSEVREDLEKRDVPFNPDVPLGTMIEVPSAAMVADKLAQESAFFCIGTNDLIQYCLAVDRANDRTAHLYRPGHPGVLRMVKQIIDAATKAEIPCTLCGEMAGDPIFTEILLGMGLRSFSMSAVSLPLVRAEISNSRMTMAKRFSSKLLRMGSESEVSSILVQRYESRGAYKRYRVKPARSAGRH